jgi:mRNA interferase MazF
MAKRLGRGEIRLCRFPPPDKERPVLVLTRNSVIDRLGNVTIAPISSTIRSGDSEVFLDEADGMKRPCVVNFHNIATVSQSHLGPMVARLSALRLNSVCAAMNYALGCDD